MILVGTVHDAVPQSYLVPPTFNVMGQLQATPLAGCPTVLPKTPPAYVSVASMLARASRTRVIYLLSICEERE